jgi:hypothetical protein
VLGIAPQKKRPIHQSATQNRGMIDPTLIFKILNMHAEEKKTNTSSAC